MAFAVGIFALALAVIASERVHRTKVALVGPGLMVVTQTIDQEEAIEAIDFNTIGLLAGMMVMVKLTETTGVYNWMAIRAGQLSRQAAGGHRVARRHDRRLVGVSRQPHHGALDGADHVPAGRRARHRPDPLVIIEIVASNIGGTATLIGDPPNIIIAGATGLSFGAFIANLAPIAAVTFVVVTGLPLRRLPPAAQIAPRRAGASWIWTRRIDRGRDELLRTVPILGAHDLRLLLPQALHTSSPPPSRSPAPPRCSDQPPIARRCTGRHRMADAVLLPRPVRDGRRARRDRRHRRSRRRGRGTHRRRPHSELLGITWVSALGSGLVDNIPFTATMIPVVEQLQTGNGGDDAYWWALARAPASAATPP